jgi:hypothetical protein
MVRGRVLLVSPVVQRSSIMRERFATRRSPSGPISSASVSSVPVGPLGRADLPGGSARQSCLIT